VGHIGSRFLSKNQQLKDKL